MLSLLNLYVGRYRSVANWISIGLFAVVFCNQAAGQGRNGGYDDRYGYYGRAVGGVSIDAEGLLSTARVDDLGKLRQLRLQALEQIPDELNAHVSARKISLRRLNDAVENCLAEGKPIPDAIKYLAGLQRIEYVFVYPEQKDIVLVGPGEGWKVDSKGSIVGATTGWPVMLFDDLLVALRTAQDAAHGGITCSIDPTPEGLARMNQQLPELQQSGDPRLLAAGLEKALGMQRISLHGVPDTTHFARVLVAADYRMKRLAMNFEPSPIRGLPSYLQMAPTTGGVQSPRFWLEPKYDNLLRDADGLAYQFCDPGVKAMTEEDYIAASGKVEHTGKPSRAAQRWAELMTEKYAQLAVTDPIFGQLQNCMELAVVAALLVKERLPEKAGCSLNTLFDSPDLKPQAFPAPKQVESKASVLKKGRHWVISASGGVAINSWVIAEKARMDDKPAGVRGRAVPQDGAKWWWN